MGRKKKQKTIVKPQTSSMGYAGNITISVQSGNKIISKKTYHNNGSPALFNFLATCLRGDYATADSMRPFYIKLFNINNDNTPAQIRNYLSSNRGYGTEGTFDADSGIIQASNEISYNKTATINEDESSATLHFRIPYAYIFENKIYMACIYGKNSQADKHWSAYYLLTAEGSDPETWQPLTISTSKNYNLLIDWTMSISNK